MLGHGPCQSWGWGAGGRKAKEEPVRRAGRSHRRRVLVDVGAVGQVDEDGVHVLDVCDDDGQVGQGGQRPGLVLILQRQKYTAVGESDVVDRHTRTQHTQVHT